MEKPRFRAALGIPGLERLTGPETRTLLREKAFTEPGLLDRINRAMHPVMARWVGFLAAGCRGVPGVWVLEGALILEMGLERHFDRVVAVVDTPERAVFRILHRDGISRLAAEARWHSQLSPEARAERADLVIYNKGTLEELRKSSDSILEELTQLEDNRGQQNP
jgi:dephospho-CoA kinase